MLALFHLGKMTKYTQRGLVDLICSFCKAIFNAVIKNCTFVAYTIRRARHTFSSKHWPEPRCHIPGRQWSGSCTPLQSQVAAGFRCSPRGQWNSDYMALWKTVKRRVIPLSQTEYLRLRGLCNPLTIPADFLCDTAHLGLWAFGVQLTRTG